MFPSAARPKWAPTHQRRGPARAARGFTLIELIFTIVLLGILAKAATKIWVDGFTLVRSVDADSSGIADARSVLERLAREVREVKYNTTSGQFCFTTMGPSSMVFDRTADSTPGAFIATCGGATPTSTTNDYAVTVQTANTVKLNLAYAGSLASPATTSLLSDAVCPTTTTGCSGFAIRYLDASFAVTASTSAVRFVELALTLAPRDAPATTSRTVVALRNR